MTILCDDVRLELRELARSGAVNSRTELAQHVASCATCTDLLEQERVLDRALALLPKPRAPEALLAKLRATPPAKRTTKRSAPISRFFLPALAAAALVLVSYDFLGKRPTTVPSESALSRFDDEAVNDHLRVVFRDQQDIASGGVHQVKPWFTGKLDFAPDVRFGGDEEFPLVGGSLAYFVDRKAAAFVYTRRLHVVTLLVFRDEGLPWDETGLEAIGTTKIRERSVRGFHVLSWRREGLGYELVSDVDPRDLKQLAQRLLVP